MIKVSQPVPKSVFLAGIATTLMGPDTQILWLPSPCADCCTGVRSRSTPSCHTIWVGGYTYWIPSPCAGHVMIVRLCNLPPEASTVVCTRKCNRNTSPSLPITYSRSFIISLSLARSLSLSPNSNLSYRDPQTRVLNCLF